MSCSLRLFARNACVLAFLPALGIAQTSAFEGRPIADIQFPNGQPLDPSDLARVQPLKIGQALHSEDIAQAIDGLFATGRFEDIVVEAEPAGNAVIVRFVTRNAWFLSGITVEGKVMESPNRPQVDNAAQLLLGAPFHDGDITQAVNRIRRLLQANGFYEAQIAPTVERSDDAQQVFLTFRVNEGPRAKYDNPVITGVTKLPDATILRATGWRIPIIHWWRKVTSSHTRSGVQGILKNMAARIA